MLSRAVFISIILEIIRVQVEEKVLDTHQFLLAHSCGVGGV